MSQRRGPATFAERLLSVREAAALLHLSRAVTYRLCEQGELPHVRMGRAIRVARADLAAFVQAHVAEPSALS